MTQGDDSALAEETRELKDRVTQLAQGILELTNSGSLGATVSQLATRAELAERRSKRNWQVLIGIVVMSLIGLATTVVLIINTNRINEVQARTSNEVLCPLFALFVSGYDPKKRDALPTKEQRDQYENAYGVLRRGYASLGCSPLT